jgi:hypothetical protein
MEAIINNIIQSTSPKDIVNNYNEALEIIQEKIKKEGWRTNISSFENLKISESDISGVMFTKNTVSQNFRKKLRNKINIVIKKKSLKSINSLLGLVSKDLLKLETNYKIKISEKEEKIQKAKKDWKEAQALAENYLKIYKEEKGNYYKK